MLLSRKIDLMAWDTDRLIRRAGKSDYPEVKSFLSGHMPRDVFADWLEENIRDVNPRVLLDLRGLLDDYPIDPRTTEEIGSE